MVLSKCTHEVQRSRNPLLSKASSIPLTRTVLHILGGDWVP